MRPPLPPRELTSTWLTWSWALSSDHGAAMLPCCSPLPFDAADIIDRNRVPERV